MKFAMLMTVLCSLSFNLLADERPLDVSKLMDGRIIIDGLSTSNEADKGGISRLSVDKFETVVTVNSALTEVLDNKELVRNFVADISNFRQIPGLSAEGKPQMHLAVKVGKNEQGKFVLDVSIQFERGLTIEIGTYTFSNGDSVATIREGFKAFMKGFRALEERRAKLREDMKQLGQLPQSEETSTQNI